MDANSTNFTGADVGGGDADDVDFYAFATEDHSCQAIFRTSWVFIQSVGTALNLGILCYERNGSFGYQTLLNQLTCLIFSLFLFYSWTGFLVMGGRVFFGPLPAVLCHLQVAEMHTVVFCVLFTHCEIVVLRYLYVHKWNHVGALNDDFYGRFLIAFNGFMSVIYFCVVSLTGEFYTFVNSFCQGTDPMEMEAIRSESGFGRPLYLIQTWTIVMVVLLTCLSLKTACCSGKRCGQHQQQVAPAPAPPQPAHSSAANVNHNLAGVCNLMGGLSNLGLLAMLMAVVYASNYSKRMALAGRVKEVSPLVFALSMAGTHFMTLVAVPTVIYARNPKLRSFFAKEVWDILSRWNLLANCLSGASDLLHSVGGGGDGAGSGGGENSPPLPLHHVAAVKAAAVLELGEVNRQQDHGLSIHQHRVEVEDLESGKWM